MAKKWWFILIAVLAVMAIGVAAAVFIYFESRAPLSDMGEDAAVTKEGATGKTTAEDRVNFALDPFIVNLADPGGKRYLSTRIVLQLNNKDALPFLEKMAPEMRDRILMILPTKTFNDIRTVEGKNALRATLIAALNEIVGEGKIINIFFQEFVVQ